MASFARVSAAALQIAAPAGDPVYRGIDREDWHLIVESFVCFGS